MMDIIKSTIERHERIALQFSGGKDSLACLYLIRPFLDKVTVYWLNTGDTFPETLATMKKVRKIAPNFIEVSGNVLAVQKEFGIPSDIVPASGTLIGRMVGHETPLIQDRYSCCLLSSIKPMHERMIADKISLIIRGQRADDSLKAPISSGFVEAGIEYLFPIEDWSSGQVIKYLREQDAPIPRFYQMLDEAPDCMTCSAWWEKGAAKYLKRYHHEQYTEVQRRLDIINDAVGVHIKSFNSEVAP